MDRARLKGRAPRYLVAGDPMRHRTIAAVAAFGLFVAGCGLQTSGLVGAQVSSGGDVGSPASATDPAGVGAAGGDAGGTPNVVDSGVGKASGADAGGGRSPDSGLSPASNAGNSGIPAAGDAGISTAGDASSSPMVNADASASESGGIAIDGGATRGGAVLACGNQLSCTLPGQTCCLVRGIG